MLPTGHVEFTWAALNLVQRRTGLFRATDYRLMAAAALAPDLLDKPLALTLYRDAGAALFWGHNLWFHGVVWLGASAWIRRAQRRVGRNVRFISALPYLLAFSGHLIADRMWGFQETLFYPLGAGFWHPWVHVGEPVAMLQAYLEIIRTTPILVFFEIAGLVLLGWLLWDRGLWRMDRLLALLRTGRLEAVAPGRQDSASTRSGLPLSHLATVFRWLTRC